MKAVLFTLVLLFAHIVCFAQKFKPDFVELTLSSETIVDTDLTVAKVFDVTGYPELERQDISIDDFGPNFGFQANQSTLNVNLGYRSFNKYDSLKFTDFQIALSIGRSRSFDNVYLERSSTPIEIVVNSDTFQIDSNYSYAAVSGFRFKKVIGLQFALTKTLFQYAVWSFDAGFAIDAFYYGSAILEERERVYIEYSRFLRQESQLSRFDENRNSSLNMYSLGIFLPASITFNPNFVQAHLRNINFKLCFTYGYRVYTIPNKINFSARTRGIRFIIRYNLFYS